MSKIKLSEFQKILGISDAALVWLLTKSQLVCEVDPAGKIVVLAESVRKEDLVQAISSTRTHDEEPSVELLKEQIGELLVEQFELVLNQALAQR